MGNVICILLDPSCISAGYFDSSVCASCPDAVYQLAVNALVKLEHWIHYTLTTGKVYSTQHGE